MWRLGTSSLGKKCLRDYICKLSTGISSSTKRSRHDVALQLDYYMSAQFAGIANAIVHNLYDRVGIDLTVLPTCPVGMEQERVRARQNDVPNSVSMGSVEQNIFVPTLRAHPDLRTTAVAAMLRKSPLALATFRENREDIRTIGVHQDTVGLVQRIFPHAQVVASPRATKTTDLLNGTYDAIQVYTTTEVPTLKEISGDRKVKAFELEGLGCAQLGYCQVLFAADECLTDDRRQVVQAFLEATFAGWEMSIERDDAETLEAIKEAQQRLKLDDEANDHWHERAAREMLRLINDHVRETLEGGCYGVIDEKRWNDANHWLLGEDVSEISSNFGLDSEVWRPSR